MPDQSFDQRLREIAVAYDATAQKTLAAWAVSPEAGDEAGLGYPPMALAYSIGSLFRPLPSLEPVVDAVEAAAAADTRIEPVPRHSLHFTFSALMPHAAEELRDLPDPASLIEIVRRHVAGVVFKVTHLRLLPLPNVLVIAGLPSEECLRARMALHEELLTVAPWGDLLRRRYGNKFPPLFWHTTLARAMTRLCPPAMRAIYQRFAGCDLGPLRLPTPMLWAINFNWVRRHLIA